MTVLDANILIYAYNADAPQHARCRRWLEELFAGPEWIGIPWLTLWAFVRIATNPRLSPTPLPIGHAFQIIRILLGQPKARFVEQGARHAQILERLARC